MYSTLNFDLGETAEMIRNTVHQFAQQEIAPRRRQKSITPIIFPGFMATIR